MTKLEAQRKARLKCVSVRMFTGLSPQISIAFDSSGWLQPGARKVG